MRRVLTLLPLVLAVAACGAVADRSAPVDGPGIRVGSIVETSSDRTISRSELLERLSQADYVLLGEKHDNADHHALQAQLVRELQARSEAPRAVAFEMMGTDQQLAITEHLAMRPGDAEGLGRALNWAESGWPDWTTMYGPIAQAALDGGGQVVAANLPRDQIREVYGSGSAALRPSLVARTGLAERLPEVLAVDLRDDLVRSHCGHAVGEMINGMFRVQRARDAIMADRLVATSGRGGGILIAGAQHVRTDRGVPWYVARLEPGADVVSVAFVEIAAAASELPDDLPFDYVWFTQAPPAAADPCAAFGKTDEATDATAG